MKKVFISLGIFISFFVLVIACSSDGDSSTPQNFEDFAFSGIFRGTLYSSGVSNSIEGYVTIEDNGKTTLDLLSGRMKGTSVLNGDNYNITINEVSGIFKDVTNITGTIEISTRTLYLSGTNPDGSPLTVGGEVPPVTVQSTGGWENLAKSAVVFSHNESCKASITIDGVTLSGLNAHYEQGGYCSPTYSLWNQIYQNYDNKVSQIYCHTVTLQALGGGTVSFEDCNTAVFYLPKNTQYTYTVNWENGETETGTLTTAGGGGKVTKCLSNNGPECDGELVGNSGNPRFNLQYTGNVDLDLYVVTPNGTTISYLNSTGQGGELDVDCTCGGSCSGENIFWTNGPSGQYQFYVKYYGGCGSSSPSSNFTIKVLNGNNVVQTKTGTLSAAGQQSTVWTYTHP
ncbi:hypothetical protein [Flavobacterium capsici]|uniref:Uncharacterized protein n=1 Tax=Flavobacterium capsici TaxID=3075618 RepID=A0AA96J760_9FLAO|nr:MULTISPECIES: hypothetical protein [unclassified Flavobacterium]WNM17954.1 hypothetical protein RN608_08005 [Flavobacterium sp. PMR2A8]WNM22006.1 hypothetical protein RN605_01305 [Flavobacterium sp. PMTSA4]